ncbi:Peptidase M64 [Mucinivorans hirudinis]|uniref:Peptidase M64 n=1 Tax=Mucinivorans hirudinis TaxID=1433126 RepID=A0A060R651_9BACT|nr:Peptidase M64 [Mucinivorans hirudinis]
MKRIILTLTLLLLCGNLYAQFDKFFFQKTLRLDFYHCGTATEQEYFFKELIEEPHWAGNEKNLIDTKEHGNQMVKLFDAASGELIYSQGYCTIFNEWQTTLEAQKIKKCYPEAVIMPFPKNPARVEIYARNAKNEFVKEFEYEVNPSSYWIRKSVPNDITFDVVYNGAPKHKVDIVLLAEGYTSQEKFEEDAKRFAEELVRFEPFKSRAKDFNIRGVYRTTGEHGVSLPGENLWKQTALQSHYYTFDSERYLIVDDFQRVRDMAANVPYDVVYILSDSKKYGGGGIYNFYGISAAGDPELAGEVYVHEFGHLFAGLGDEYVGTTGYDGFYKTDVEPWEENLTTLVDFDKKFWKKMLPAGTKIPTEDVDKNEKVLGVYEGGGYQNKGIYRPWRNCIMRDLRKSEGFCPVCIRALEEVMNRFTK